MCTYMVVVMEKPVVNNKERRVIKNRLAEGRALPFVEMGEGRGR